MRQQIPEMPEGDRIRNGEYDRSDFLQYRQHILFPADARMSGSSQVGKGEIDFLAYLINFFQFFLNSPERSSTWEVYYYRVLSNS